MTENLILSPAALASLEMQVSSRRAFLRKGALTAAAVGVLGACKPGAAEGRQAAGKQGASASDSDHSGGTNAPHPAALPATNPAEDMDAMHEKGIKA
ncbi:MAG: twin-arginine translocation signal domain-containing protein, partial [Gemmatimonadaceae bacterium]